MTVVSAVTSDPTSVTAWATVAVATFALAALMIAGWQALLSRRVVAAALDDVQQSRRARIDARSPRVIVLGYREPALPAALQSDVVTPNLGQMDAGARFDLPGRARSG